MTRKMLNGMKQKEVLILTVRENEHGHSFVTAINTETGHILPEFMCLSKKPLQVGAKNFMYVNNDVIRCEDKLPYSKLEEPEQRIQNILKTFEVVKNRYENESEGLYEKQRWVYTQAFGRMVFAIDSILFDELKPKKENAFQIQLKNIEIDIDEISKQLNTNASKGQKNQDELLKEKTNNLKDEIHKLDLIWDLQSKTSLQVWEQIADEGMNSEELLSVKPKEKKQTKTTKKAVQKTLLEF